MAKRPMTPERKKKLLSVLVTVLAVCAAGVLTYYGKSIQPLIEYFPFLEEIFPQQTAEAMAPGEAPLRVHILDVGQADCILIQGPERTMVIDGGEAQNGPGIAEYLRAQGVEEIDYYLNTHPHADHLGGIVQVMEAIPTREFLYHPVPAEYAPTTRGYQSLLRYVADNRIKATVLNPGDTVDLGDGAVLTCLAPLEEYDDMNNNSLVERLVYGENSFLFTGDAEKKSEQAMLGSGAELSAKVYSTPHHGSSTSTSREFLEAVHPDYATISVGKDNDYGHPHPETLERFRKAGITCLRTDRCGTIVFACDGRELTVETEKDAG